jgi:phosphoglycolate phosphatase-like HAD superfamily hydrolase
MLLEAMAAFDIEAATSWFLGDSITDAQAGRAAGVRTILVGNHPLEAADIVVPTLRDVKL